MLWFYLFFIFHPIFDVWDASETHYRDKRYYIAFLHFLEFLTNVLKAMNTLTCISSKTPGIYGGSFAAIFGYMWQNFLALNTFCNSILKEGKEIRMDI